ncbi:MAG TPA: selenocysteine-specific translation elongation factor [Candidatus Obscuribacter sp.]|nr:selenocysteine-specific translation elongation factor [Candidatus Obscuribacter sp.]
MTKYFTIATAGHVDHGKTSLLKALTGVNPDRLKEEREREMTTDLGFAPLFIKAAADSPPPAEDIVVGFIDVPGHGKFLKNMLAGVGGLHLALLVVAADEGVMPQTLQHIKILSLLGVRQVLLAISKIDLAPEQVKSVGQSTEALLALYNMQALAVQPVSAVSLNGIDALSHTLAGLLLQLHCNSPAKAELAAYLPVDRVFNKSGYGKVVTGTLVEGSIKVGDSLTLSPGAIPARVRGLETFGRKLEAAHAGQRLAVNLAFKDEPKLSRGSVLSTLPCAPAFTLLVTIEDLGGLEYFGEDGGATAASLDPERASPTVSKLKPQPVKLYHGTAEYPGYLRWLEPAACTADFSGEKEDLPAKNRRALYFAQIALDEPGSVRAGDRFVLRYGDHGIAGGSILGADRPHWFKRADIQPFLSLLSAGQYAGAVRFVLQKHPQLALKAEQMYWFLPQSEASAALAAALEGAETPSPVEDTSLNVAAKKLAEYYYHPLPMARLEKKVTAYVLSSLAPESHAAASISIESLRQKLCPFLDRCFLPLLTGEVLTGKLVQRQGDKLVPVVRASSGAGADKKRQVLTILEAQPVLELSELAKQCGLAERALKEIMDELSTAGEAEIVSYEFAASRKTIEAGHRLLGKLWQARRDISPSEFREAMQVSRKYTMALLAYYDDHQITRRVGNGRMLLKAPPKQ